MPAVRSRGRSEEANAKPRADAYVGLLSLSLLALIVAMLFAYLNWDTIKEKPKPVSTAPPASRAPAGPGPGVAAPPGQAQPGGAAAPTAPGGNPPPQKK
jgi:hypothetical protein